MACPAGSVVDCSGSITRWSLNSSRNAATSEQPGVERDEVSRRPWKLRRVLDFGNGSQCVMEAATRHLGVPRWGLKNVLDDLVRSLASRFPAALPLAGRRLGRWPSRETNVVKQRGRFVRRSLRKRRKGDILLFKKGRMSPFDGGTLRAESRANSKNRGRSWLLAEAVLGLVAGTLGFFPRRKAPASGTLAQGRIFPRGA